MLPPRMLRWLFTSLRDRFQALPPQTRSIILTVLVGIVSGIGAVALQRSIEIIYQFIYGHATREALGALAVQSFIAITVCTFIAGVLLSRVDSSAGGSGVPQSKVAYWRDFGVIPFRHVWVRFVSAALSIGSGVSLGREGPTIHIAGGLASQVSAGLGTAKQATRHPMVCGSAAGLSAAFNAPLAAATFVLEGIIQDLNSRSLGKVLLASLFGAFVVYALIGPDPAFEIKEIQDLSWHVYLLIPIVAALAAILGWVFQTAAIRVRQGAKAFRKRIPLMLQPVLGGWVTWVCGISVFAYTGYLGVFGLGHQDLTSALAHDIIWQIALILLLAKLIASIASFGLSGCGGVFSPTLFLGGMAGAVVAELLKEPLVLTGGDRTMLVVVGATACMGSVVRAPIFTILIVFEMTHEFNVVPGLMLGTLCAQGLVRLLHENNFYDALLKQDGYDLQKMIPPRDLRSWQSLPIAAIMNFQLQALRSFEPDELRQLLEESPHRRFPVIIDGELKGIVSRPELAAAVEIGREPKLVQPTVISPRHTVREAQAAIIQSAMDFVVVEEETAAHAPIGVVTLHDILRVQMRMADTV